MQSTCLSGSIYHHFQKEGAPRGNYLQDGTDIFGFVANSLLRPCSWGCYLNIFSGEGHPKPPKYGESLDDHKRKLA